MSETISARRLSLFDGLLTGEELQADTGWGQRTILRREAAGLPVIKIGATKLYPAEKVRDWLLSRTRSQQGSRGRGRPRSTA
jgi:hypothetical protein